MSRDSVPFNHPWDEALIGEVANVIVGGTPSTAMPSFWGGSVPWMASGDVHNRHIYDVPGRITELGLRCSNAVMVEPKAVAMALAGQGKTRGTVALTHIPVCTNQSVALIKPDADKLDPHFLYQSLLIRYEEMRSRSAGGGRAGLTKAIIEAVPVQLPSPSEQLKIARILTTLDNLIEKTQALIAKYQAIKQGMMHDLFTRGVDAHGHLRPPQSKAPDLYKQSELGWIPKEWMPCGVDEVGSVQLGRQRSPKHQSGRFTTPYLRVANVFDGFIDYSDVLEMDFTPTEKETYSLLPGDVLLNEGQSLELVGRSAIYTGEPGRFCFQNTLIRFRAYYPNDLRFCRSLFKRYLDTGRFMTIARQTTSVAHLGADRLARMTFPCPHPDEQHRIANILSHHERRCELDRKYKDKLFRLKSGLMQDLLTGKVRVKMDEFKEVADA